MKLAAITFSLLVLTSTDVLTTQARLSQSHAARAFTIKRRIYIRQDNGMVKEEGTEVEYHDSEGNVRYERNLLNPHLVNGTSISGRDKDAGWYFVGQGEQQQGLYIKMCPEPVTARSLEQLRAQPDFVREEKSFDFRVAVLSPVIQTADFHEIWIAPELDGVEVKRITHWTDGDYSFISEATSITLGEPSDGRARLPRGLKQGRDMCKEQLSFPTPRPHCPVRHD